MSQDVGGGRFRVTKELRFCYGHRLLNYMGKCRHLHGHNARVLITMEGETLDELGMVVDFSTLKKVVGGWLDANFDHVMLLHQDDPIIPELERLGERFLRLEVNPTAEQIAKLIFDYAKSEGFPVVEVILWETETSFATYRKTESLPRTT